MEVMIKICKTINCDVGDIMELIQNTEEAKVVKELLYAG